MVSVYLRPHFLYPLPKVSTALSTKAFTSASLDTSTLKGTDVPSFPTISAILETVFLVPSSFRSAQTTFAPSLANKTAVSKPMPLISYQFMKKIILTSTYLAAPVTIATFPERRCPVIVYVFIKESKKKRGKRK